MKYLILIIAIFSTLSSYAVTFSEKRARGMVSVLESEAIQVLLKQNDGMGNIVGIKYSQSLTTDFADYYDVTFIGHGVFGDITCTLTARVDGSDGTGAVSLEPAKCK